MAVDLDIIMDDLEPWYRAGKTYYFSNRWVRKFPDDARAYYGFLPTKYHRPTENLIKVYYTEDGELIISNCRDRELQNKIRKYMENWYQWKKKKHIRRMTFRYPVAVLIRPYLTELNENFWQVRYKDRVCNMEKSSHDPMDAMVKIYTYKDESFEVETGMESLDLLVLQLAKDTYDSREWPLLSAEEWKRYYLGEDELSPTGILSSVIPHSRDAWEEFVDWGLPEAEKSDDSISDFLDRNS